MATRRPRVLITRSPHQASELADRLRVLDIEPILIPAIEIAEPTSFAALDAAIAHLDRFHWLLFTSANAVEAFHRRLNRERSDTLGKDKNIVILSGAKDPPSAGCASEATGESRPPGAPFITQLHRVMSGLHLAAIGPSTAQALKSLGLASNLEQVLVPPQAIAESFAESLLPHTHQLDGSPTRFLLLRAQSVGATPPREHLPETLRAAGADVTVAPVYRTVIPPASIPAIRALFHPQPAHQPLNTILDAITFTSSSTVRNLLSLCEAAGATLPPQPLRISIGPITSQTLRDAGYPPHAEAATATLDSLAEAVLIALKKQLR